MEMRLSVRSRCCPRTSPPLRRSTNVQSRPLISKHTSKMAPRADLTGFNPQRFAAASGSPANDPWKRHEAWRSTGPFTRGKRLRGMFPGFGIATVAFAGYMVYEQFFLAPASHGHGDGHGEGHH
ncbi:NADH-ubiquinone oxidoreductase B12 subunit family-domain-containing protein [Acrodontium crateriforme]|uniref:NADH-ubiquinone oxidoreductase B12 subunit family-domain-containing protein n=1 Tax=Acrodontium crateriforme TaxID=150365 RepID=A0AAQ3R6J2_9PEZI|nr:NADH-ubiquinone oxidoreductase B12 subunit family-domain-containing protein [Acrodontium crateriforme]